MTRSPSPADAGTAPITRVRPGMVRRTDIPPERIAGSSRSAIGLEWIARLAAVLAIVLLVLVVFSVQRGRLVQDSAKGVVADFHMANDFFAARADFRAPTTAREQMQQLAVVLRDLEGVTRTDVDLLAATVPDVQRLLEAGRGDVRIAHELDEVATTLQQAGRDLNDISSAADGTVSAVNSEVATADRQVEALNAQLAQIERKLALLPAVPIPPGTDGPISLLRPGGN